MEMLHQSYSLKLSQAPTQIVHTIRSLKGKRSHCRHYTFVLSMLSHLSLSVLASFLLIIKEASSSSKSIDPANASATNRVLNTIIDEEELNDADVSPKGGKLAEILAKERHALVNRARMVDIASVVTLHNGIVGLIGGGGPPPPPPPPRSVDAGNLQTARDSPFGVAAVAAAIDTPHALLANVNNALLISELAAQVTKFTGIRTANVAKIVTVEADVKMAETLSSTIHLLSTEHGTVQLARNISEGLIKGIVDKDATDLIIAVNTGIIAGHAKSIVDARKTVHGDVNMADNADASTLVTTIQTEVGKIAGLATLKAAADALASDRKTSRKTIKAMTSYDDAVALEKEIDKKATALGSVAAIKKEAEDLQATRDKPHTLTSTTIDNEYKKATKLQSDIEGEIALGSAKKGAEAVQKPRNKSFSDLKADPQDYTDAVGLFKSMPDHIKVALITGPRETAVEGAKIDVKALNDLATDFDKVGKGVAGNPAIGGTTL